MEIRILGTRGEIKPSLPYHSRHSGVLVDGTVLLDLGEKEFLDYRPDSIFVTHLHPDHAFFVTRPFDIDIPLYAPEQYRQADIRIPGGEIRTGGIRVTPVPTHHSLKVRSSAYLVEKGGVRLLYTGDLIWINKEYHHLIEGLDLVITDGSFLRKGGMVRRDRKTGRIYGHNGVPDLISLFKRFTCRILFVHFGSWFYEGARSARRRLHALGKENGILVEAGYDGMLLRLK